MDTSRPRKVLVIDDEAEVVQLLRDILGTNKYEAIATTQWTDAVDALAHEDPDLMLMDLNMPTIDGPQLLKFVREQGYQVPVMVVSGFISDEIRKKLDPLHVWAYVEKPFEVQHLTREIARVLRESETAGSPMVGEVAEKEALAGSQTIEESESTPEEPESTPKVPPPALPSEVPIMTGPGMLPPRRTHRAHRARKPMPPNQAPLLSRIFRKRVTHFFLIAIICMALAGIVVVMAERSNEVAGQYANPPADVAK